MKVLTGHLTQANIKAINAILSNNLMAGKVSNTDYFLSLNDCIYTVTFFKKDRGLIPVAGSELRLSKYTATFKKKEYGN